MSQWPREGGRAANPGPVGGGWLAYLQARENQGDTLLAEVLQQPGQAQHHSVVNAADVGALQNRRAWRGHWEHRPSSHTAGRGQQGLLVRVGVAQGTALQ